jgi:Ca-activated chloride channel family protein
MDFDGFEVYDIEPPSIPDVLADRPVIVFGKWRGTPRGNILIHGISGDCSFKKKINMTGMKPSEGNSALRYLWARHRIAILSDYNKLNPQDESVREVTNLGLTYNLLTAYTSFVAIDTQVRVKDGQAVTVKQPLPLPQGVSDLALGNKAAARKIAACRVPSSATMTLKGRVKEARHGYRKDERLASETAVYDPNSEACRIRIGNVNVTDGLQRKSVQKMLERNIGLLNACFRRAALRQSKLEGEIVFTLLIDPHGKVIKVNTGSGRKKLTEMQQCLIQSMMKLRFPAPKGGDIEMVTITFIMT